MIIGAVVYMIIVIGWLNEGTANSNLQKLCDPYLALPETETDRIPDGCIAYYYKNR